MKTHIFCIARPYDEELLELLLMLEAAEQKDEVWESFGREMTLGENNLVEENIRGGGGDVMFDKVLSKEKRTTGFWPQLETVSDQVVCLSLFMSVSHKRFQDTARKDLLFSEEEHLVPGDHWIHRDISPVVKTVSPILTLTLDVIFCFCVMCCSKNLCKRT